MWEKEFKNRTWKRNIMAVGLFRVNRTHANSMFFYSFRINCYNALNAQSPFGGFMMSGNGREM